MANPNPFKVTALAAAMAAAGAVTPAYAFNYESGDFKLQADTSVSVGAGWRASDRDYRGVGAYNAGVAAGSLPNPENPSGHFHPDTSSQDNGNLNWKKGSTYTEIVKAVVDVELNYKNYGAFVRGKTFYDARIINGDGATDRPNYYPNPDNGYALEPAQSSGTGGDILDAFVWGDWWIADRPLNVRLGKQVISWGEGLFFANGINTINPIDVPVLLAPGSELKEALIPVEALFGSFGITDTLSVEAFYQFKWRRTEVPDCGTFFSTTDLVGAGCKAGFFAGGRDPGAPSANALHLPTAGDIDASDDNQYGIAFRYLIEAIQTEVGFYHIRYNSRLPIVSGYTPGNIDAAAVEAAANFQRVGALAQLNANLGYTPGDGGVAFSPWTVDFASTGADDGLAIRNELLAGTATPFFGSLSRGVQDLTTYLATSAIPGFSGNVAASEAFARQFAANFATQGALLLPYGAVANEYPDDIRLWGFSFNSNFDFGLPGGETALSGEISYRENQPMQIEDSVTLTALIGLDSQLCRDTGFDCYEKYGDGEFVSGYVREEFWQAEVAFIHFFDRILGADRWTAILNMAYNYATIPDKETLLLNSSYNADPSPFYGPLGTADGQKEYYPTPNSWGYRLRFSGDYSNVFAGINLRPSISFAHDVEGVTPGPVSNFLENRKSLGLQLEADYLNTYSVRLGYTDFYGAEPYNQLADRDFYSLSASASF